MKSLKNEQKNIAIKLSIPIYFQHIILKLKVLMKNNIQIFSILVLEKEILKSRSSPSADLFKERFSLETGIRINREFS